MKTGETEIDRVAKLFLAGPREPGDVREATAAYDWLSAGRVYWVFDRKLNQVLVVAVLEDGTPPVCLTGNTAAVEAFLSRQFGGTFPGIRRVGAIAQLLKDVAIGPAASIGTREFLESQRRTGLEDWLKGREKDPAVFERLCSGIQAYEEHGEWRLRFNVFNTRGGVDAITASGSLSPLGIRKIKVDEVKPAGEFRYPLEG